MTTPNIPDPAALVRDLIAKHFPDADLEAVTDDTVIATLAKRAASADNADDEDDDDDDADEAVDDFYDALETATDGSFFSDDREPGGKVATTAAIVAWINEQRKETLASGWRDALTPLQRALLAGSWAFGMALIVTAIIWKPEGEALNMPVFGLGMFIAAQLKFGVQGVYEWLAKNQTKLVEKLGHAKLFWFVLLAAYGLSLLEIGLLFAVIGIG